MEANVGCGSSRKDVVSSEGNVQCCTERRVSGRGSDGVV